MSARLTPIEEAGLTSYSFRSSYPSRAFSLEAKKRLKFFAALFAPDRGQENYYEKNDRFDQCHGQGVIWLSVCQTEMFRQPRLLLRSISGSEISQLVGESRKCPAKFRRRKFVQMNRHNSPRPLHHELNQKPAHDQQRCGGCEDPKRNKQHSTDRRYNDDTAPPPLLREKTHHRAAADRAGGINNT